MPYLYLAGLLLCCTTAASSFYLGARFGDLRGFRRGVSVGKQLGRSKR